MSRSSHSLLVLSVAAAASLGAQGSGDTTGVRLARLFADGMVVQRDLPIPVWGWAPPGARLTVRLDQRAATAVADQGGRWQVRFPALPAGGPHVLTVSGGSTQLRVRDVLAGDVWVASGQSNMEFRVRQAAHAAREIASAHDTQIREFKVPIAWAEQPQRDVAGGSWALADSAHVGEFSAVAYFFAREIRTAQHVPIGIVNSTWGGSAIETWLSPEALGMNEGGAARALAGERVKLDSVGAALRMALGDVPAHDPGLVNGKAVWADPALDESAWRPITVPGDWESQGYAGMDGVGWYRTTVTLSADEAARGARLVLGMIDDDDVTWVNGVEVGRTVGYNVPRAYTVPATALRAGPNVIAVRVSDYGGGGGITGTPVTAPHLEIGGATRPLAGPWKLRVGELSFAMDAMRLNKVAAITYNAMVQPLLPMPITGVIWYQGESNANDAEQAAAYRAQFATLIRSWRGAFTGGQAHDFPFLWVQLPNFGAPTAAPVMRPAWAVQREAMAAALSLPKTGQAIAIDVGEANDIHPTNKQDVGHRLGLVARRVAYGEAVLASGPTYRSHEVRDGRAVLTFENVGGGLAAHGPNGELGAFTVAGADRRFLPAHARIEGDRVIVWSEQVPSPVAVRYAWADNPADANLFSRAALPAAPFRTDAW